MKPARFTASCLLAVIFLFSGCSRTPTVSRSPSDPATAANAPVAPAEKLPVHHLPNAYRIHPKVISGGLPDGPAGFKELQSLGVKTLISVDGATPDVKLAKQFGLRYVHMPHGYDGISENRIRELAKAVQELEGPIYIHCHHGKHRSPAAATVACVSASLIPSTAAAGILKAAGTSPNYRGLHEAAETARPLDTALLQQLRVDYREIAELPPMAVAMVEIEHRFDRLKELSAANWKAVAGKEAATHHDAAHDALLLKEGFVELARTDVVRNQPSKFRELLNDGERAATELEQSLRSWSQSGSRLPIPAEISAAFARVTKNCSACHTQFRDVPLGKK